MEIEAKYAVTGALDPDDLSSLDLAPYRLRPLGEETHQDVILDTAMRTITGQRHGLRIRRSGARTMLTLKAGGQVADGIHEREEIEVPLLNSEYDPRRWPAEIGERVRALTRDEPLYPLIEVRIRRRTWAVERAGKLIGELVFDEGTISANGQTEPVREIEVEVKADGTRADLEHIGQRLLASLPLQPEARTKLQRGLALLAPL
ncbi:MAG: CYTH domain-containing protein [Armatimonadota bacterium]|nr:CYTH domain-containing protein [Armatimonadota bacterium]